MNAYLGLFAHMAPIEQYNLMQVGNYMRHLEREMPAPKFETFKRLCEAYMQDIITIEQCVESVILLFCSKPECVLNFNMLTAPLATIGLSRNGCYFYTIGERLKYVWTPGQHQRAHRG